MMSRRNWLPSGIRGVPSGVSLYWYTPPRPSSTTNSLRVMRTGGVSHSTKGSPSGEGSGVDVGAGVDVATTTGVGVAATPGVLGLPPPPQERSAIASTAVIDTCADFIVTEPSLPKSPLERIPKH